MVLMNNSHPICEYIVKNSPEKSELANLKFEKKIALKLNIA